MAGFLIALPLGPIAALCIRMTLDRGWGAGLAAGLGAAVADSVYGGIASFGLTYIIDFLRDNINSLRALGGVFLLYLAYKTAAQSFSARDIAPAGLPSLAALPGMTFFVTISNPVTVFAFLAAFTIMDIAAGISPIGSAMVVLGVFAGSMAWWAFLSGGVSLFRAKISGTAVRRVNIFSAAVIAAFGIWIFILALKGSLS